MIPISPKLIQIRPASYPTHDRIFLINPDATIKLIFDRQEGLKEIPKKVYTGVYEIVLEDAKKKNIIIRRMEIQKVLL